MAKPYKCLCDRHALSSSASCRTRTGSRHRHAGVPAPTRRSTIFYSVLTIEYARQIAGDWNTRDERSGFAGYVLRLEIAQDFIGRYQVQRAGSDQHLEYWIPAEELAEFNANIIGGIEVVESYEL